VRWIVGFPAGGGSDVLARLLGQWLSERLGQPFVIENRPGGGGNIATEAVVRAPADGYTLLQVSAAAAINATLYDKLNFNFIRDIAPVASIDREPLVMVVSPPVPARTVPEFIAYAKANPGKISMASAGNGTPSHVSGELFKMMAGVNMVHVPYCGGRTAAGGVREVMAAGVGDGKGDDEAQRAGPGDPVLRRDRHRPRCGRHSRARCSQWLSGDSSCTIARAGRIRYGQRPRCGK
jgi:tripartite-type tricarboxylate transporter receptor subunit TctC